ncbi:MAG: GNAT family N-acetyltransferase [Acidobacteria bacterium]|nr:GNAT family N-acetyltransferase [Acidobacteriota bacterium]
MLIRKARVEDGVAIASIAETVRYRAEDADPTKGYLVFVGTPEEYSRRLEGNDTSYVAEVDGKVVGFLLTTLSSEDTATHIASSLIFSDNALLIDQIGVLPEFRAAAAMYSLLVAEVKPKRITACIMHGPLFNQRSVGFFKGKCGFQCIGEYDEGDGFTWGIYEWKDR